MDRLTGQQLLLACAIVVLLIPPLVFLIVALHSGMSPGESANALAAQYSSSQLNLAVCSALALAPLLPLALFLWIRRRRWKTNSGSPDYALAGALPVLAVAAWANFEFWSAYLPERVYPGFPHGLELVIGPVFFAPVGMLLGLGLVALARRMRR